MPKEEIMATLNFSLPQKMKDFITEQAWQQRKSTSKYMQQLVEKEMKKSSRRGKKKSKGDKSLDDILDDID